VRGWAAALVTASVSVESESASDRDSVSARLADSVRVEIESDTVRLMKFVEATTASVIEDKLAETVRVYVATRLGLSVIDDSESLSVRTRL